MEKNCKWHFGKEGGIDIGPNDPIHQTFKGNPYYSIVREAIQNSLDAVNDNRFPVKVSFQYFDLKRLQYPSFFQLEEHINQSLEYYKTNNDAQRLFGDMSKYLNGNESEKKKLQISCLKISDSNTKGMHFADGTDSPFYAFLRAAGVSAKISSGSGGSFGFGKGAYFALSPIKTVVVSSKDTDGNVFFEGATRLTTHKNEGGEKVTAYGFYDNKNGEPTTVEENIPEIFRRAETGTDINIIGLWEEVDRNILMIKSVLNNFWLAIHEHKLVVTIADVTISRENLEQVIDEYFSTEFESSSATEIESWNPKPYYKAVKYAKANDQFKSFIDDELPVLGKVRLYVYLEKGLPNRTSFFRGPKMVVFKKTNRQINGYAAVFICDNYKGNEILRKMENPAHNEWNENNYTIEGKTAKEAKEAKYQYDNYVKRKLESLLGINKSKKIAFMGLEEFLSIPEDLLEKDDDSDLPGDNSNNFSGTPTKDLSHDETGMQTTNKGEPVFIKPTIKEQSEVKEETDIEVIDVGEEIATVGGDNGGDGGDEPGTDDGNTVDTGEEGDKSKDNRVLVKVKLKVAAQKENDKFYHNLIVSAEKDIARAELELLVSGDNDKDDGITISTSDNGIAQENKLKGVTLSAGKNKIKIHFADNLKHSIKIKAYELQ